MIVKRNFVSISQYLVQRRIVQTKKIYMYSTDRDEEMNKESNIHK